MKTKIDVEEVESLQRRLAEINAIQFSDIEWCRNGLPIVLTPDEIEQWRFIGLSNANFVEFSRDWLN